MYRLCVFYTMLCTGTGLAMTVDRGALARSTKTSSSDDSCARSFEQVTPETGYERFDEALQGDCLDESMDFNDTIVTLLKRRFSDVRVYRGHPVGDEDAKTWRK